MIENKTFRSLSSFPLECGTSLSSVDISYTDVGDKSQPVVWICHALTANADPQEWWPGLVGEGKLLDPARYRIICANNLGSCYGTTGPTSIPAGGEKAYKSDFPLITIRDIVHAHKLLQHHLGVSQIHLCIGGSMGATGHGMGDYGSIFI